MKVEIIPAILPKDFAELDERLGLVKGLVKTVQIDICDGQFVPTITWPYKKTDESYEKIIREEQGLPGWEELSFEIDLMVNYPERIVDEWVIAGANRIIIHAEVKGSIDDTILKLKDRIDIGLAVGIETSIDIIESYKESIETIQLMGINHIGFQGQDFDAKVIDKIKEVKMKYPELKISIDGGVSMETAPLLIEAGANRLVVGSAIFNTDNIFEAVQKFKRLD